MRPTPTGPNKSAAVSIFVLALLFWAVTISRDALGFVPPMNGEAVGYDLWTTLVWGSFAYSGIRVYRALRGGRAMPTHDSRPIFPSRTWTGNLVSNPVGSNQPPTTPAHVSVPVTPSSRDTALVGVGGWLRLLIVRLWIGMVIRLLGGLAGMSEGASFITLLNVGSALIAAISAYLLERKNVKGVLLAKIYMVLDAAYYLAALVFGTTGANGVDTFPAWFKPVGFLLGSVLWFAYLTLSKRVCNTYKAIPTGTKTGAATAL